MTAENDDTFDPPYVKGADDAADTQNQLNDEMARITEQYEKAGTEEGLADLASEDELLFCVRCVVGHARLRLGLDKVI